MNIEKLTAQQVMSRVMVAVAPEESVLMAWEVMRRAGVHHLPVVRGTHLIGVLTREDVTTAWNGGPEAQSRLQVQTLVSRRRTPRVHADEPLECVCSTMLDASCDAVPVLAEDGALIGLITARDVLAAVAGRTPPEGEHGQLVTGMFRLEPLLPAMMKERSDGLA